MDSITTLYEQLTSSQQHFFDHQHQIGYGAVPIQLGPKGKFDPFEIARTRGGKPIGEFPDISRIEREIEASWGEDSIPMHYLRAIFSEPAHDLKNQPLPGTQTNRRVLKQRGNYGIGEFEQSHY
ncbi:hypothetical protein HZA99_00090 [Candidatus Woesearchaeota archaeon]|nr:hypothetical protein [Candidatus Woesearchaeota archaeon]